MMAVLDLASDVSYETDEALEVVLGYCCGREPITPGTKRPRIAVDLPADRPAFAYAFYDAVPRHELDGLATVADVLVANGPNAQMTGYHFAQLTGALPAINAHLSKIPVDVTLSGVPAAGLAAPRNVDDATRAMWEAWSVAYSLDGINHARVNKLLHRVRPNLFPLYDNQTGPYLGVHPWQAVREDLDRNELAFSSLEKRLQERPEFGGALPLPTRLRLHDILLWCEARGRPRAKARRLGRALLKGEE